MSGEKSVYGRAKLGDPVNDSLTVWNGSSFVPLKGTVMDHPISDLAGAVLEVGFLRSLKRNYRERGGALTVGLGVGQGYAESYDSSP